MVWYNNANRTKCQNQKQINLHEYGKKYATYIEVELKLSGSRAESLYRMRIFFS